MHLGVVAVEQGRAEVVQDADAEALRGVRRRPAGRRAPCRPPSPSPRAQKPGGRSPSPTKPAADTAASDRTVAKPMTVTAKDGDDDPARQAVVGRVGHAQHARRERRVGRRGLATSAAPLSRVVDDPHDPQRRGARRRQLLELRAAARRAARSGCSTAQHATEALTTAPSPSAASCSGGIGPAVQVALRQRAAQQPQALGLRLRLDALGDDRQPHGVRRARRPRRPPGRTRRW